MTEYKPGDLALATVNGFPDTLVRRRAGGGWQELVMNVSSDDDHVTDLRPMRAVPADAVVIDVATLGDIGYIVRQLRGASFAMIADQIEAQTRPPRPAEPLGLGAVVEDADGRRWIRGWGQTGYYIWRSPDVERARFADLKVTRVLSEGWSE